MRRANYLFLGGILMLLVGCRPEHSGSISGDLMSSKHHLEGKMLYLTDADNHLNLLDSALVRDGKFTFRKRQGMEGRAVRMAIRYYDEIGGRYLRRVGYSNPYMERVLESQFYYTEENVQLKLDTDRLDRLINREVVFLMDDVDRQTEIAFHHHKFKIGPGARKHNMKLVREFPYSVDLLHQLNSFREKFPKEELRQLAGAFERSVRNNADYIALAEYLEEPAADVNVGEVKIIFVNN